MNMLNYTEYNKIIGECKKLSIVKNKLYGCGSLKLFSGMAILSRINDKIMRLNNMIENKIKDTETIEDNFKDLINYAVYYIMLKRGKLENVL